MKEKVSQEKMTLDKLAIMVARGFSGQDEKIDGVEKRLTEKIDGVEKRLGQQIAGTNNRIDKLVDDKVSWTDHKRLADRVSRLEMTAAGGK